MPGLFCDSCRRNSLSSFHETNLHNGTLILHNPPKIICISLFQCFWTILRQFITLNISEQRSAHECFILTLKWNWLNFMSVVWLFLFICKFPQRLRVQFNFMHHQNQVEAPLSSMRHVCVCCSFSHHSITPILYFYGAQRINARVCKWRVLNAV